MTPVALEAARLHNIGLLVEGSHVIDLSRGVGLILQWIAALDIAVSGMRTFGRDADDDDVIAACRCLGRRDIGAKLRGRRYQMIGRQGDCLVSSGGSKVRA